MIILVSMSKKSNFHPCLLTGYDEINKLWQTEPKQYAETEEKINIAAEK